MLTNLMNNPGNINNIKISIDNLHEKITNLKNSDMDLPLIEEEVVVVPNIQDISPKRDIGLGIVSAPQPTPKLEEVEEEIEETPELEEVEELPTKVRETRRKSTTRRPNKPFRSNKKFPQPRKDDQ